MAASKSETCGEFLTYIRETYGREPTQSEVINFVWGEIPFREFVDRKPPNMFETQKYTKKPFEVTAVRVTEENLYEVAQWCTGEIAQAPARGKFIKVRVIHAVNERQTQAFPGDWVLYAGTSYRVYTDKAFNKGFEPSAGKNERLPEGYPVGDKGNLQPAFVSMAGEEV